MRVAVLGAGGPAGVNVCRALNDAGHEVIGIDQNSAHLVWAEPFCFQTGQGWELEIRWDEMDVLHAQPDGLVERLAERERTIGMCLPSLEALRTCRDKFQTATIWADSGLRQKQPLAIIEPVPDHLHLAKDRFGFPFWLRSRSGAGARGATLVEDLRTAHHWIRYWETRGENFPWVVEEYLPGREFCWTSLWHKGYLVAAFARERLEWIYPHLAPSGRTGTPSISETVHYPLVNRVGEEAVTAVDPKPNGIYCVDLVEDADGNPRPTEINAGRWATTSPLYSELGPNMPDMHVRLAAGETVEPIGNDIYPAGVRLSRHIDCGHVFTNVPVPA